MGGDDYYAELDYIEVMERAKEGYEDEAVNIEDDALYQADLNEQGKATCFLDKCVSLCVGNLIHTPHKHVTIFFFFLWVVDLDVYSCCFWLVLIFLVLLVVLFYIYCFC
ncbi:hypothetical protein E2C01_092909 [Portunus trituberculatus]|uniref:Uncharacterized protein n=1 Tax=Portunus trituberculatus TaxID=210409 RepID=A0A5B7JRY2_PORTR|nr:hypothetical protein [Portunus trituberculatus]